MIPVVTPAEMAAIDAAAPEPVDVLIDRAGRAVARAATDLLGGTYGRTVTVLAGKGNNGADGRVAAERLERRGVRVTVHEAAACPPVLRPCDLVIDAAFGTGFRGTWTAPDVGDAAVLAVDVPSGVDAQTGAAGRGVLPADRTVTFQALKPGLVLGAGSRLAGHVDVVDIGLDVSSATQHVVERADVAAWWPARASDAHKWRSALKVIAGSRDMPGAARLCTSAAARAGASLVSLSAPDTSIAVDAEIVQRHVGVDALDTEALADIHRFAALAVGPGLGRDDAVLTAVRRCIGAATVPVVVDGDGLFAAAWSSEGAGPLLRDRELATVLTPHDGEFGVLTGARPGPDRVASARAAAVDFDCTVLLKGPTTVIASPSESNVFDTPVWFVANGDDRLATAGTGDVLTGMIGAALAFGAPPDRAAAAAAWLHAEAGNRLGRAGLVAGDLIAELPDLIGGLR